MKDEATLTIIFCTYYKKDVFEKFILNEEEFKIDDGKIEKKFIFDKYEKDLGKKYCNYQLIRKKDNKPLAGSFEITPGNHTGYCFLDAPGITFKILFLQKRDKMKDFIKSKYTSMLDNIYDMNKEFELSLNQNDTEDRASLILINCLPITQIKKDGKLFIDLKKVEKKLIILMKMKKDIKFVIIMIILRILLIKKWKK